MSLEAIVIAGANGAGKTTFARQFIPVAYPDAEFLNADEIQREGAPFAHRVSAGKEFLRRLSDLERRRASFAVEITMSSRMYVMRLRRWSVLGYRISLHFIELPSADEAVRRVTERVAAGGHSVPEADIRRRFERGLLLFRDVYKPLVDEWYHWFSDERGLRLVDDHEST
jgi:predicted ABC-type ATPase